MGVNYYGGREILNQLVADGFDPECITEWDIASNPAILEAYDVVVFSGHHEYISRNTFDALEANHYRGGNLAFFSGNDLWWQVRFDDQGDRLICYKYRYEEDPLFGIDDSLVTNWWHAEPVNRPGETLQGVGYAEYSWWFENEDFHVADCNHFAFEGTGLKDGDVLGEKLACAETDHITPFSPSKMDILLSTRRDRIRPGYEHVTIPYVDVQAVYYEDSPAYGFPDGRGGQVFSGGTNLGWGSRINNTKPDYQTVRKVVYNIIRHMADSPRAEMNVEDLMKFSEHWLGECDSPGWCDYMDFDMNKTVDLRDLAFFAESWSSN